MFSNIENVNILTSVLKRHGVRRVVVCPGSRNAPLVHNLNEIDGITCYPVTDERSAGFVALGMALGDPSPCPSPVAVCVTSIPSSGMRHFWFCITQPIPSGSRSILSETAGYLHLSRPAGRMDRATRWADPSTTGCIRNNGQQEREPAYYHSSHS